MSKILRDIVDIVAVFAVLGAIPFIAWTKMTLGAALACAGTFLSPLRNPSNPRGGTTSFGFGGAIFKMSGGLRFIMVASGAILLISAALDSKQPLSEAMQSARAGEARPSSTVGSQDWKPHPLGYDDSQFSGPLPGQADEPAKQ